MFMHCGRWIPIHLVLVSVYFGQSVVVHNLYVIERRSKDVEN